MGRYLTGWPAAAAPAATAPASPPPPSATGGMGSGSSPRSSSSSSPSPPPLGAQTAGTASTAASAKAALSGDVPAPSLPYDLLAVVNHSGGMTQGHYTSYVKEIGRWFRFDDTWVHEVTEEEVLASEAYILFYFQRGADTAWRPPPAAGGVETAALGTAASSPPPATGKRRLSVP